MDKSGDYGLNPKERYQFDGAFDLGSYDDDLRDYREYFDENGWPLFGDYDPYALKHPITGLSWLDMPRIPQQADAGTDYEYWFQLAEEFDGSFSEVLIRMRELSANLGARYVSEPQAVRDNVGRIRSEFLPRLKKLIEGRQASVEMALLWGEFRQIAERLSVSVDAASVRHARAKGGSKGNKDAQLKFYLHWRRFYEGEKGWTARRANAAFIDLVKKIIKGEITPPPGFLVKWWRDAHGEGNRGIPDSFRRISPNREKRLLASLPEEDPRIPPLDRAAYPSIPPRNLGGP